MRIILTVFISSLLYSCGSSSGSSNSAVNPHAQAHNEMHQEYYQEELTKDLNKRLKSLAGSYAGTLPCADCEGIDFRLDLDSDMTYSSEMTYKGKSEKPIIHKGTFSIDENWMIELDTSNKSNLIYFQKEGDNLKVLDKNGKIITGDLGHLYTLRPTKS